MTMIHTYLCQDLDQAKQWLEHPQSNAKPLQQMWYLPYNWQWRPQFSGRYQQVDWGSLGYVVTFEELQTLVAEAQVNPIHEPAAQKLKQMQQFIDTLSVQQEYALVCVEL